MSEETLPHTEQVDVSFVEIDKTGEMIFVFRKLLCYVYILNVFQ